MIQYDRERLVASVSYGLNYIRKRHKSEEKTHGIVVQLLAATYMMIDMTQYYSECYNRDIHVYILKK